MHAGDLRYPVVLQEYQVTSRGTRGEPIGSWVTINSALPCGITPLSGKDMEIARQIVPNATHKINIRYHPKVGVVTWRIVFDALTLYIGYVQDVGMRHRQLMLTCYAEQSP